MGASGRRSIDIEHARGYGGRHGRRATGRGPRAAPWPWRCHRGALGAAGPADAHLLLRRRIGYAIPELLARSSPIICAYNIRPSGPDLSRATIMATFPVHPGIDTEELQGPPHAIAGVPTSIAAFVGYTKSGIDHRAQQIGSFSDFERLYGGLAANSELSYAVLQFFQNGGAQAYVVRTPGASGGLPATADIIGDQAACSGIYALLKLDLFNLLCIPDATRANATDPTALDASVDANAIYGAAMALCNQWRAFLLLDSPPNLTTAASAADWKSGQLGVVDPNGAAYFPRLLLPDPLNKGQPRSFAPCGVVAGVYAATDRSHGVWQAPAGTGAVLNGVLGMSCQLGDAESSVLNPLGLNCFRTFPAYRPVLWGARTLVGADARGSQWKYVPVRRTALFIEESLYRGTQWVVFEANEESLWAAIRLDVGAFMQNLFLKGAFQGSTPTQAYFVKCDSGTTTQADLDQGVVNILVGFAPLKPAEFVTIQIAQATAQAR